MTFSVALDGLLDGWLVVLYVGWLGRWMDGWLFCGLWRCSCGVSHFCGYFYLLLELMLELLDWR